MTTPISGVSFVVPVRNGSRWLDDVLSAILAQGDGRPMEVIVVDDASTDRSVEIAKRYESTSAVRVLDGFGRGAAAAINLGIRHAVHPVLCQVDQDVILEPGWMSRVTSALATTGLGASQGHYIAAADARLWSRVMALDLKLRYSAIGVPFTDHVCTGNAAYRTDALRQVDLFDESMGYGYDNDMSYRLGEAGYRLVLCHDATSIHRWRDDMIGYLRQQYGFGYGRLDVVFKHRRRWSGDDVSGFMMLLHAPLMLTAIASLAAALMFRVTGYRWQPFAAVSSAVFALLTIERFAAGVRASVRFRDPAGLWFAPVHLLRDGAWALALGVWTLRRLRGRPPKPSYSM